MGERDCEDGMPYEKGEEGLTVECSSFGLWEVGVRGDNGDCGQGERNGRPGLCGPGETGDMGPGV